MNSFVNREEELRKVDEAFSALLDKHRLLRSPIIEFYGTGGIGKTTLLRKVEQKCNDEHVPSIWADASQSEQSVSHMIIEQAAKYGARYTQEDGSPLHQSVQATKTLLKQGPAVLLLDAIDTTNDERVRWIEAMLKGLVDEDRLLVVLASTSGIVFPKERSVARKLTSLPLSLFDRSSCETYLNNVDSQIVPELRNIIFEWTRGYPLAMQVMTEAISAGHDPRQPQGQNYILALMKDQIIMQHVLARVEQEKRADYYASLRLLSVPRRFNLVIMQDLIERFEHFAPALKRESSLAYFPLTKEIQQATEVLKWNMPRAGYSVDAPIRNIFLLELKMEQPEDYNAIHTFLAQENWRLATEVTGTDRVRYLREYLYHSAISIEPQNVSSLLEQVILQIIAESPGGFSEFYEEFIQDEELKETLGEHTALAISLMHSHLAGIYHKNHLEG